MPRFTPEALFDIGCAIFEAAGCSTADAKTVTAHLVESSLFGHDSHGTLRYYEYIDLIRRGRFDPKGKPQVVEDRPCAAVVDGGGALGQIGGAMAMQLAIDKAKTTGVAAVALHNTSHVGRIGAYPLQAARAGLIGLAFVNAGQLGRQITPYGGLDGKLSTNPIAFAAPRRAANPIMVDMTTSAVAEGKIRVFHNRGDHLPDGWIIDHQGRPSNDPADYLGDPRGAILPLGGPLAYKGYCLSMMVEIMGGALGGQGCAAGEEVMRSNGVLFTAYNLAHFTDPERFLDEVEVLVKQVHSSRIDPQIGEILLPGQPEFRSEEQRRAAGVPIDPTTWGRIVDAARSLGLDPTPWDDLPLAP